MAAACLIAQTSARARSGHREFGTFTDDLLDLREQFLDKECPVVAIKVPMSAGFQCLGRLGSGDCGQCAQAKPQWEITFENRYKLYFPGTSLV